MAWKRNKPRTKEAIDHVYTDIVVDLETLGTEPEAAILSIGAVRFHPFTRDSEQSISEPDRTFYARLNERVQLDNGRMVDPDTLLWWQAQSKGAKAVFEEETEDVETALKRFADFCKGARRLWGNGNMFDNAILRNIFRQYKLEYPIPYRKDLDLRTVTFMWRKLLHKAHNQLPDDNSLVYDHTALSDAKVEALGLQQMLREIREKINGFKEI